MQFSIAFEPKNLNYLVGLIDYSHIFRSTSSPYLPNSGRKILEYAAGIAWTILFHIYSKVSLQSFRLIISADDCVTVVLVWVF